MDTMQFERNMKRIVKQLFAAALFPMMMTGCRAYSYEEKGARNIEPQHQVVTVPIVADVELLSTVKITYTETFANANLDNVDSYKYLALAHAIKQYNADFMIGAIFEVNTNKDKSLEVIITGVPAKYTEFRKATPDDQWFINSKVQ